MVVKIKERMAILLSITVAIISELIMLYKTNLENMDIMVITLLITIITMYILLSVKIKTKKKTSLKTSQVKS